jgi:hypothetical protein
MTTSLDYLTKGAAQAAPEAASEDVDIDNLTSEEIDTLVVENGLEVDPEFKTWTVEAKRKYLNEKFGDEAEGEAAAEPQPAPTPAAKKGSKKAAAKTAAPEAVASEAVGETSTATTAAAVVAPKAAKGKKKGTAVSTDVSKDGEVLEKDPIADLVHEIENLKESDALKVVDTLIDQSGENYIKLGGVLTRVQSNAWFKPYSSFQEYVENRLGMKFRLAGYYMQCYNALANGGIPYAKVVGLGWTKLALIATVITLDNVDEWVNIAKGQNALTLKETVKKFKDKQKAEGQLTGDVSETSAVSSLTFKPHADQREVIEQAIEKAKDQSNTPHATVALYNICLEYLGTVGMVERLKPLGIEKAAEYLNTAFPEWDISISPAGADDAEGDSAGE